MPPTNNQLTQLNDHRQDLGQDTVNRISYHLGFHLDYLERRQALILIIFLDLYQRGQVILTQRGLKFQNLQPPPPSTSPPPLTGEG